MSAVTFRPSYAEEDLFDILRDEVAWVNRNSPRDECFMAAPGAPTIYSYGNNNEKREALHTYNAVEMHPKILSLAEKINAEYGTSYNVCVLNYYKDERQHLGWHADDSPEQKSYEYLAARVTELERALGTGCKSALVPDPNVWELDLQYEGETFHSTGKWGNRGIDGKTGREYRGITKDVRLWVYRDGSVSED